MYTLCINNLTVVIIFYVRGGNDGPNYSKEHIDATKEALRKAGLPQRIMVDCSHGNSGKKHTNQPIVSADLVSGFNFHDVVIDRLFIMRQFL